MPSDDATAYGTASELVDLVNPRQSWILDRVSGSPGDDVSGYGMPSMDWRVCRRWPFLDVTTFVVGIVVLVDIYMAQNVSGISRTPNPGRFAAGFWGFLKIACGASSRKNASSPRQSIAPNSLVPHPKPSLGITSQTVSDSWPRCWYPATHWTGERNPLAHFAESCGPMTRRPWISPVHLLSSPIWILRGSSILSHVDDPRVCDLRGRRKSSITAYKILSNCGR